MTATLDPPTKPPATPPTVVPAAGGAPSPVPSGWQHTEIPAVRITGAALTVLGLVVLSFVLHLLLVTQVRYERTQQIAHADFRTDLARGVAPVGQTDIDGALLDPGRPVAVLRIPALGTQDVVLEGTTSAVLENGLGHRRDTCLPGQAGVSVVMGRRAAYGGPFSGINLLRPGDAVIAITGQGRHDYRIRGVRRPGDPVPPALADGAGRLTLVTADGPPYLPTNVLYVDADLMSAVQPMPSRRFGAQSLPSAEKAMATDTGAWTAVVLWGQALLLGACAVSWAVARWGRWQAWVVGVPLLAALGTTVADHVARVLPNLY